MRTYYVYILASGKNGTLYVGVTADLQRRIAEHGAGTFDGFTKNYGVKTLVYWESTNDVRAAIEREKRLKRWVRRWKIELIERENPGWADLSGGVSGLDPGSWPGVTK
ncbi:MAG: hypothetical protein RL272_649 [Candidatus Parcubacteria bacterium]|jgi:putative endonuclease